jgi:hypothetical protein
VDLFEHYVYGRAPTPPPEQRWQVWDEEPAALDGTALRRQVTLHLAPEGMEGTADAPPPLELLLYVPADAPRPVPTFLGLNFYGNHTVTHDPAVPLSERWIPSRGDGVVENRATEATRGTAASRWAIGQTLGRGYAVATLYHGDLDPDHEVWSDGVHPSYYAPDQSRPAPGEWGAVAAWSWGLSRALDYLVVDPDVDGERVAVMGHSRNGKAALWAGAMDERFALIVSHQSGCTGAALSRRRMGETVFSINLLFPHWFTSRYAEFSDREDHLPLDQHLLIALLAPRPVLVLSGVEDDWSDPEGEFLGAFHAEPVYQLLGTPGTGLAEPTWPEVGVLVGGPLAYYLRSGGHTVDATSWTVLADYADEFL